MNTYYYMNVFTGDVDTLEGWEDRGALLENGMYVPVKLDLSNPEEISWQDDTGNIIGWVDDGILHYRVYSNTMKDYIPIIQVEEQRREVAMLH